MTANDFYDWKKHPVTVAVFDTLRQRREDLKEELVGATAAGENVIAISKAGAILAIEELLNMSFEESHGN